MANVIIYLKAEQNAEVTKPQVSVADIASIYCADNSVSAKAKAVRVYHFHENEQKRQVISILKVIELIEKECGQVTVISVGENATLIELVNVNKHKGPIQMIKMIFVAAISFFGTALPSWHFTMTLVSIKSFQRYMNL